MAAFNFVQRATETAEHDEVERKQRQRNDRKDQGPVHGLCLAWDGEVMDRIGAKTRANPISVRASVNMSGRPCGIGEAPRAVCWKRQQTNNRHGEPHKMTFEQSLAIAVLLAAMGGLGFLCVNYRSVYKPVGIAVLATCSVILTIMLVYSQGYRNGVYAQWEPAMKAASDADQRRHNDVWMATTDLARQGVDTSDLSKANPLRFDTIKPISTVAIDGWIWTCILILAGEQLVLLTLASLLSSNVGVNAKGLAKNEAADGNQE